MAFAVLVSVIVRSDIMSWDLLEGHTTWSEVKQLALSPVVVRKTSHHMYAMEPPPSLR